MLPFVISLVKTDQERTEALDFINKTAAKLYDCDPPPPPEVIFTAKEGAGIVGTVALELGSGQPFPLEIIYEFDYQKTPWPFQRELIAQFGRWMATVRGISKSLMYKVTEHALLNGKIYGLTEVKEPVRLIVQNMGIELRPIPGARLLIEKIIEKERGYYLSLPSPNLFMVSLQQKLDALKTDVMSLLSSGKVVFA